MREAINNKFPLYCLGFGHDVNFEFLEKMSLENNGVARRIYDDSLADLQLKGFYAEVATPLLTDVLMIYEGGANLTRTNFSQYYNGSEIVVAGQITDNSIETFSPQVVAISGNGRLEFSERNASILSTESMSGSNIRRLWAYLTVKQLLEKQLKLDGKEKERAKKEALELSLKYRFVTPLTSMVVTKPPGGNTQVLHKPREGKNHPSHPPQQSVLIQPQRNTMRSGPTGSRLSDYGSHGNVFQARVSPSLDDFAVRSVSFRGPQFVVDPPPRRVRMRPPPTQAPVFQRFVRRTVNSSLPLCYDVDASISLKLLHNPNRELSMIGQLDSFSNGGFKRIVIHNKNQHIDITLDLIRVEDGQNVTEFLWKQNTINIQRGELIQSEKKTHVIIGDTELIILLHEIMGRTFLWPVFSQVSGDKVEGLLAVPPVVYERMLVASSSLTVNGKTFAVSDTFMLDYSWSSSLRTQCWLTSAENALEGRLSDFVITDL